MPSRNAGPFQDTPPPVAISVPRTPYLSIATGSSRHSTVTLPPAPIQPGAAAGFLSSRGPEKLIEYPVTSRNRTPFQRISIPVLSVATDQGILKVAFPRITSFSARVTLLETQVAFPLSVSPPVTENAALVPPAITLVPM